MNVVGVWWTVDRLELLAVDWLTSNPGHFEVRDRSPDDLSVTPYQGITTNCPPIRGSIILTLLLHNDEEKPLALSSV